MELDGLTIALDVDGTLAEPNAPLCRIARDDYGIDFYPEDIHAWDHDIPGTDHTVGSLIHSLWDDERYVPEMPPLDGAIETIHSWFDDGARLIVTTHRPESAQEVTQAWLDDNDVPYDAFHFGPHLDKHAVGADVLIDDWWGNINDAVEAGLDGLFVIRYFNYDNLDELVDSPRTHTARDVTENTPLSLAANPHLQWEAFDRIVRDIAPEVTV